MLWCGFLLSVTRIFTGVRKRLCACGPRVQTGARYGECIYFIGVHGCTITRTKVRNRHFGWCAHTMIFAFTICNNTRFPLRLFALVTCGCKTRLVPKVCNVFTRIIEIMHVNTECVGSLWINQKRWYGRTKGWGRIVLPCPSLAMCDCIISDFHVSRTFCVANVLKGMYSRSKM